jgi:hypothetical protein
VGTVGVFAEGHSGWLPGSLETEDRPPRSVWSSEPPRPPRSAVPAIEGGKGGGVAGRGGWLDVLGVGVKCITFAASVHFA